MDQWGTPAHIGTHHCSCYLELALPLSTSTLPLAGWLLPTWTALTYLPGARILSTSSSVFIVLHHRHCSSPAHQLASSNPHSHCCGRLPSSLSLQLPSSCTARQHEDHIQGTPHMPRNHGPVCPAHCGLRGVDAHQAARSWLELDLRQSEPTALLCLCSPPPGPCC